MTLRVQLENSNEVLEPPFAEALKLVKEGKAHFIPEDMIDGKTLNSTLFGIDVQPAPSQ